MARNNTGGPTNYSMSFDSTMEINTMEYICKLLPHEYNWSTNPTILSASDAIAMLSIAAGRNLFDWFRSLGIDVEASRKKVPHPP